MKLFFARPLGRFLIALMLVAGSAAAADFSFTGVFSHDTDVRFYTFTVLAPTSGVTIRTWSYSGGTNAAGALIPSGGFEPVISLWSPGGYAMNPGYSGPCGGVLLPDPITGACGDVYDPTTLSFPGGVWDPGTYTLAISLYSNPAVGNWGDGFLAAAWGIPVPSNYSCQVGAPGVQGNPPTVPVTGPFCDEFVAGVERTGFCALDITNVDRAGELPEPGTASLVLIPVIACVLGLRRRLRAR